MNAAEYNVYEPTADWLAIATVAVEIEETGFGLACGTLTMTCKSGASSVLRIAATAVSFPDESKQLCGA